MDSARRKGDFLAPESPSRRKVGESSVAAVVVSLLVAAALVYYGCFNSITKSSFTKYRSVVGELFENKSLPPAVEKQSVGTESCDLFTGRWVFDEETRPMYKEEECGYMTEQVTCMRNGRRDDEYQKWRWEPRDCSLPRFNAKVFLEKLRGKRLLFVGDSLNRNQWESMICLVLAATSSDRTSLTHNGSLSVFRLQDYAATMEFYWAPFLVESNSDDPGLHSIAERVIMPNTISKHARHWSNADFLVFNTYIWWMNTPNMKVLRGSFEAGSTEVEEVERLAAYERVLRTWAEWVDQNVDPSRTRVFFMSMSLLHIRSSDWNNPGGIRCANETAPVLNATAPPYVGTDRRLLAAAAAAIGRAKVPISMVNITTMSEYRKDAHTSVYTIRQGKLLTPGQKADPMNYADCIHWCLPGLPDVWNELLYNLILHPPPQTLELFLSFYP
ncbi:protein trichome birefringence-like 28 isoform X1 [Wolffia australiana]